MNGAMTELVPLIFNPAAGSVRRNPRLIDTAIKAMSTAGVVVAPEATTAPGDATRLAQAAVERGAKMVIVCGGDGTINEAAQALVGTKTALAVWPGGTANVLARELGFPRAPKEIARVIAKGEWKEISVGCAVKPGSDYRRYFLLMAGVGLDAAIVRGVRPAWKKISGYGAFWASGMSYLARLPLTPFSLDLGGEHFEGTFACIANAPSYGGGFRIAPQARIEEGELDVCLINSHSRRGLVAHALMGLTGRHLKSPKVVYRKTRATLANSNDEAPVQLDGEYIGRLPMQFESIPRALRVIVP